MRHYSYSDLDMYRDGIMPFRKRLLCKLHLLHCSLCRDHVVQLNKDAELIARMRQIRARGEGSGDKDPRP